MANETQYQSSQRMYGQRAETYDASWHTEYSKRFMDIVKAQPGDMVLDLACGTGLQAAIAAHEVGEDGLVVAVDATDEMLDVCRTKMAADRVLARRVRLLQHDVTDLPSCPDVEADHFDLILCSNAFVLFTNPSQVIAQWRQYLKPGGRMVIDVPHEHSFCRGLLLERVVKRLGIPFPSSRDWIKSVDSLRQLLEGKGFSVDRIEHMESVSGSGPVYLDVSQADAEFDELMKMPLPAMVHSDDVKDKAKALFNEEWKAAAVEGKIEICDTLYVYVARKI